MNTRHAVKLSTISESRVRSRMFEFIKFPVSFRSSSELVEVLRRKHVIICIAKCKVVCHSNSENGMSHSVVMGFMEAYL